MKRYDFELDKCTYNLLFPRHLINSKNEILEILMEATRYILVKTPADEGDARLLYGKIVLIIDKMSRLFFCSKNKTYSIVFPFTIRDEDKTLNFLFQKEGIEIAVDSELISHFISIIKSASFRSNCSLDFADSIDSLEEEYNKDFWVFMRYLLLMEDGYVRYDMDQGGYDKAVLRGKKHTHPLHHLDVFYTSNATFKLGLEKHMNNNDFIDCINVKTDCKYLKSI